MSDNSPSQAGRDGTFDVFLSAVSSEFKAEREQLRDWLRKKSVHIVEEADFIQGGGTLWDYLKVRIAGSPVIVCLIGAQSGSDALPAEVPEGSPPRTYTQWEFWLGWGGEPWSPPRRQRVLVYFPADLERRLAEAEAAAQGDPDFEARLRRQREHIFKVKATGIHWESFTDPDHLIKLCLAQDLLCRRVKKRIGMAVAFAVLIGMVWAVLANQGKHGTKLEEIGLTDSAIAEQQKRDSGKLDAIAEQQKRDSAKLNAIDEERKRGNALLEQFIRANDRDILLSSGKGGESAYENAMRIVAEENKITVAEARLRVTAAATDIEQDPAAPLFEQAQAAFFLKDFAKAYDLALQAAEKQSADLDGTSDDFAKRADKLAETLKLAGRAAFELARFSEAAAALENSLVLREKTKDPVEWANTATWLAVVYDDLAAYAKAEPLKREVLSLREAILGRDHPEVAIALNNLAELLRVTNRLTEAEPLYRRAWAIDEKSFGPDHPNVARDIDNLALLLDATNRTAEAEPLHRRALAIDEKSLGPDHPSVAIRLNNLAASLPTNRQEEAEPLFRRALDILVKTFGPDDPKVAKARNNLAGLLLTMYRLAEAEPLFRQALASDEKIFGKDHPGVAIDLNNLAGLLAATNRLDEAKLLYRRALAIDEKSLGPDHPNVAIRLNNLARLLQATSRLPEAEPLFRRAVVILATFQKQTGHEHPNFKTFVLNYEFALVFLGKPKVAETVSSAVAGQAEK